MKRNTDNRAALLIVVGHLLQAVARVDAAAAEGHMKVYQAIVKAAQGQRKEA